ncbi:hypothetical protein Y032_0282g1273 [Ancylostoma ceylanicum]|nr:hypothetical protein Y032_0282g1273 [Ancylostoma ceylanicum]
MIDWCFDIEMYYASSEQNIAAQMRNTFQEYKQFSFRYNGVLTSILVALGLAGSLLLLKQIYSSHVFSKRLAIHLGMICIWDSLYLVACLATYGVPSLLYGMIPVYGIMAYILFLLQPFASFCVSCTIWQVFAITLERYLAVSKPLEQRARTARFAAGWLCAAIAAGAFVLNLLPVPFERQLVPCFEIVGSRLRNHTLLKPYDDSNSRLYRFVVHFFPDLIFRAPLPIIFIGTLTVKTIHACNQRSVGNVHLTAQINRNIPLRLYLLNFKFILCNTLYMFNTILLELLGYGESVESNEEGLIDRYMNSFYLTDASNMLLVLHSATNWLLFYKFPTISKNSRRLASITLTSSYRVIPVRPRVAEFVLRRIAPAKRSIGVEILTKICATNPEMVSLIVDTQKTLPKPDGELYSCIPSFQQKGEQVGHFVEQVLKWLPKTRRTMMTICTFNARTLASEASIEDLMVQARKIRYDVIGLTETRRHRPLNATFDTGEELFLGTCDSRGVGGVGVLVNTNLAMNIDSFEQLTTRIGRLRLRRCGSMPALTVFVAYAPTSSYDEDEIEAFYMDLEKFYREDHTFYKVIVGDFNAKIGPRRTPEELHIGTHGLQWNEQGERLSEFIMTTRTIHGNSQFQKPTSLRWTWESPGGEYHNEIDHIIVNRRYCLTDVGVVPKFYTGSDHRLLRARFFFSRKGEKAAKYKKRSPKPTINWDLFTTLAGFWEDTVVDNIDEEYERLIQHLRDSAKKAEGLRTTKRRLSHETLELIRQRGAARAAGNYQLTSELARRCREAIKEDLKERRAAVLAEAAEAGRSIRNTRRDFANRKTKMTALRRPDGTITSSRRVMEKVIYDFYSDLFDSHVHLPPCHLREDEYVIPSVLPSEVRHAIKSVKNRTAPGPDRIRPEHLKNLPTALVNTLARLFTRYLSECKVPSQWKTSRTVLLYKKGDPQDIGNYRPICLLSVVYKLFTRVILNRIERTLDEGQPCEQAGFRKGFSTIDHIHTVTRLIEVSREYKMPLCLTFIDLKKAFDTVETEAVLEALGNQGVPTQYIRIFRELYSNFTTRISPFYDDITIDVRRGVRQGDTVSPKLFTATLEDVMRRLEWDNMGVRVDGRLLHHLRFADDIVLITPSISQAERMLADFDDACGKIGLQLNLTKTMFMRNGWVPDAPFSLNGTTISECSSYVYLGREVNMMNDLAPELGRRKRAAWGAYKSIEDVVKKTKNIRLRAHLFNTTVLPALTYASETWALRKQDENAVSVIERSIERVMLGMTRLTQVRAGIRSSTLRQQSKIRDAAVYAKSSKIRWAGHVMRLNDHRWTRAVSDWTPRNVKRTTGRPPTRWSDFFTKSFKERYDALRVSRTDRTHWTTLARERDKWKDCWRPLGLPDDQRESRFCDRGRDEGIRQLGRRLGHAYFHSNIQFSAEQWKIIRAQVVAIIVRHTLREPLPKEGCCSADELQENLTRAFNFVLCEMRSGVLCAAVEAKKRNNRSISSGVWAIPHDVPKKPPRAAQNGRLRYSLQNNGLLPLLISEASSR